MQLLIILIKDVQRTRKNVASTHRQEPSLLPQTQSKQTNTQHYQLVIENHAIDNHLNIENEFAHNY